MKLRTLAAALLILLPLAAFADDPPAQNPFFEKSPLPFQAPPFDRIKDGDFQPAIEEGMKRELAEVQAIANSSEPPTFANTIEAMERSGDMLRRVQRVFGGLTQSNTNPALQKTQSAMAPKGAAHRDAIVLDPKLFARIKAIYDARNKSGLDAEQKRLVERYYMNFIRSGAQLNEADKTALRALNQEQSKLTNQFRDRVLADTNASAIVIDDKAMLDGLPESDISAAAERAKGRGLEGKWLLTLQNTTQQPAQTYLKNRDLRLHTMAVARVQKGYSSLGDSSTWNIVKGGLRSSGLIAPNTTVTLSAQRIGVYPDGQTRAVFITEQEMTDIHARSAQLFVDGRIEYWDVFKHFHWTTFCYVYHPFANGEWHYQPHETGNDMDEPGTEGTPIL